MDSVTFGNITKSITGSVETIGKPGGLSVTDNVDDIQKIVTEIDSAIVGLSKSDGSIKIICRKSVFCLTPT